MTFFRQASITELLKMPSDMLSYTPSRIYTRSLRRLGSQKREWRFVEKKKNECCGYWGTRKEKGLREYLLNRVRGILKTTPKATPFESEVLGKAALKNLKRFASVCRSRGLNPQGWGYFGDLKHNLAEWEAKASNSKKEAVKTRNEQWQLWAEEACLGGAKAGHGFIKTLPKWRATTTSTKHRSRESGRSCDILIEERNTWEAVWTDSENSAQDAEGKMVWNSVAWARLEPLNWGAV